MSAPVPAADGPAPPLAAGATVADALANATVRLSQAGVDGPRRDARRLLAAALGQPTAGLPGGPEGRLGQAEAERFNRLVARRQAREPVSRILGRREFWSLEFAIAPATLDPRPDSETLVEAVTAWAKAQNGPLSILDLGTGSGCLLLALLSELPESRGLGVDLDPAALAVARANAAALGLAGRAAFAAGDWGAAVAGRWQVIVCNPPYVPESAIGGLAPEVACYEPRAALDGGPDGLAAYRRVIPDMARLLAPRGLAALELGAGLADAVEDLLGPSGLVPVSRHFDLGGVARCLLAGAGGGKKVRGQAKK